MEKKLLLLHNTYVFNPSHNNISYDLWTLTSSLLVGSLLVDGGASAMPTSGSVLACVPRSIVCGRLLTFSRSNRPGRGFCLGWSTDAMTGSDGGCTWWLSRPEGTVEAATTAAAAVMVVAAVDDDDDGLVSVSINLRTRKGCGQRFRRRRGRAATCRPDYACILLYLRRGHRAAVLQARFFSRSYSIDNT